MKLKLPRLLSPSEPSLRIWLTLVQRLMRTSMEQKTEVWTDEQTNGRTEERTQRGQIAFSLSYMQKRVRNTTKENTLLPSAGFTKTIKATGTFSVGLLQLLGCTPSRAVSSPSTLSVCLCPRRTTYTRHVFGGRSLSSSKISLDDRRHPLVVIKVNSKSYPTDFTLPHGQYDVL